MELKEQIKGELLKQKEEKQQKMVEENSKLNEIEFYSKPDHPLSENFKKVYTESGVKFKESGRGKDSGDKLGSSGAQQLVVGDR